MISLAEVCLVIAELIVEDYNIVTESSTTMIAVADSKASSIGKYKRFLSELSKRFDTFPFTSSKFYLRYLNSYSHLSFSLICFYIFLLSSGVEIFSILDKS